MWICRLRGHPDMMPPGVLKRQEIESFSR
jgi:hypothetical protein